MPQRKLINQIAFKFRVPPRILGSFLNPLPNNLQKGIINLLSQEKFVKDSKRYIAAKKILKYLRNQNRGPFPLNNYETKFLSEPFSNVMVMRYLGSSQRKLNNYQPKVSFEEL